MTPEKTLSLENLTKAFEKDPEYIAYGMALDVTEQALVKLGKRNQSWLAKQMGVSRQRLSNIFGAQPNLQLLSIAQLAVALGCSPKILLDDSTYLILPLDRKWVVEDIMFEIKSAQQRAGIDFDSLAVSKES